jgi:hypothetical protein
VRILTDYPIKDEHDARFVAEAVPEYDKLREAVARAIWEASSENGPWDGLHPSAQADVLGWADAAIAAVRAWDASNFEQDNKETLERAITRSGGGPGEWSE